MRYYNIYITIPYGLRPFIKPLIVRFAPYIIVSPKSTYNFLIQVIYESYLDKINKMIEERADRVMFLRQLKEYTKSKYVVNLDMDTYYLLKAYADEMQLPINDAIRKAIGEGVKATDDLVAIKNRLNEILLNAIERELKIHSETIDELQRLKSQIKRTIEVIKHNNKIERAKAIVSAIHRYMDLYGAEIHEIEHRFGDSIDWLQKEFGFNIFDYVKHWMDGGDPIKYVEEMVSK